MADKRKDAKGRNLRDGEDQMADGRYRFRYHDCNGNRQAVYSWKLVSTDKVPAGKRDCISLREREKEIAKDIDDGINTKQAKNMTLNDCYKRFIDSRKDLKDSTVVGYNCVYDNAVRNGLGKKKVSDIIYSDIKALYNHLGFEKEQKYNSVRHVHKVLNQVFKMAVKDGLIRMNPCEGALDDLKRVKDTKAHRDALTIEQQTAFLNFVKNDPVYSAHLPMFTVFLGTGARSAELFGLTWNDVDMKKRTISINHNLLYLKKPGTDRFDYEITSTKTSAGRRTIPMLSEVRSALLQQQWKQRTLGIESDTVDGYTGFIFTTKNGKPYTYVDTNHIIDRIIKKYNSAETEQAKEQNREPVLLPHFSCHTFRHTFCTRFCENEDNVKVIQTIMGHSNISITMDIYCDVTGKKKEETFNELEGKIKIS